MLLIFAETDHVQCILWLAWVLDIYFRLLVANVYSSSVQACPFFVLYSRAS